MSGLSLAVGPRTNDDTAASAAATAVEPAGRSPQVMGGMMGSLRVVELQLFLFIMVFSASGLVPAMDLAFPAFLTFYIFALSRLVFPGSGAGDGGELGGELFKESRNFRAYVAVGTTVGLFLPLAYALGGFARRDDHATRAVTPHLFLLSCQVLTENVMGGMNIFSPPVRALVPLLYTVKRVFLLIDWTQDVCFDAKLPATASIEDVAWTWFGRTLAVANLVYFSGNLFGFLIPRFLPAAFEKYFKERNEIHAKASADKRSAAEQQHEPKSTESKKAE